MIGKELLKRWRNSNLFILSWRFTKHGNILLVGCSSPPLLFLTHLTIITLLGYFSRWATTLCTVTVPNVCSPMQTALQPEWSCSFSVTLDAWHLLSGIYCKYFDVASWALSKAGVRNILPWAMFTCWGSSFGSGRSFPWPFLCTEHCHSVLLICCIHDLGRNLNN